MKHVFLTIVLFLLQTALSIFFQEAAIPSCAQGAGTHFGQVSLLHHSLLMRTTRKAYKRESCKLVHSAQSMNISESTTVFSVSRFIH